MSTLEQLETAVLDNLRPAATEAVEAVVQEVRDQAPFDTGELEESIRVVETGEFEWLAFSDEEHAGIQDAGAGPYTIRPRNKQALFWDGALFPVKKVEHPGFRVNTGWWSDFPWESTFQTELQRRLQ